MVVVREMVRYTGPTHSGKWVKCMKTVCGGGGGGEDLLGLCGTWWLRAFAVQCIQTLVEAVEGVHEHFDLKLARAAQAKGGDRLALHLQQLVGVAFNAATGTTLLLRPYGVALMRTIVTLFGAIVDPDMQDTMLLSQYKAQITSSLRIAFGNDASPELADAACSLASHFAHINSMEPEVDVATTKRLVELLTAGLPDLPTLFYTAYGEHASSRVQVATLRSLAELHGASVVEAGKGNAMLANLIKPHLPQLCQFWFGFLQDYHVMSSQPKVVQRTYKGNFYAYSAMVLATPYFTTAFPTILNVYTRLFLLPAKVEGEEDLLRSPGEGELTVCLYECVRILNEASPVAARGEGQERLGPDMVVGCLRALAHMFSCGRLQPSVLPAEALCEVVHSLSHHIDAEDANVRGGMVELLGQIQAVSGDYFDLPEPNRIGVDTYAMFDRLSGLVSAPIDRWVVGKEAALIKAAASMAGDADMVALSANAAPAPKMDPGKVEVFKACLGCMHAFHGKLERRRRDGLLPYSLHQMVVLLECGPEALLPHARRVLSQVVTSGKEREKVVMAAEVELVEAATKERAAELARVRAEEAEVARVKEEEDAAAAEGIRVKEEEIAAAVEAAATEEEANRQQQALQTSATATKVQLVGEWQEMAVFLTDYLGSANYVPRLVKVVTEVPAASSDAMSGGIGMGVEEEIELVEAESERVLSTDYQGSMGYVDTTMSDTADTAEETVSAEEKRMEARETGAETPALEEVDSVSLEGEGGLEEPAEPGASTDDAEFGAPPAAEGDEGAAEDQFGGFDTSPTAAEGDEEDFGGFDSSPVEGAADDAFGDFGGGGDGDFGHFGDGGDADVDSFGGEAVASVEEPPKLTIDDVPYEGELGGADGGREVGPVVGAAALSILALVKAGKSSSEHHLQAQLIALISLVAALPQSGEYAHIHQQCIGTFRGQLTLPVPSKAQATVIMALRALLQVTVASATQDGGDPPAVAYIRVLGPELVMLLRRKRQEDATEETNADEDAVRVEAIKCLQFTLAAAPPVFLQPLLSIVIPTLISQLAEPSTGPASPHAIALSTVITIVSSYPADARGAVIALPPALRGLLGAATQAHQQQTMQQQQAALTKQRAVKTGFAPRASAQPRKSATITLKSDFGGFQ